MVHGCDHRECLDYGAHLVVSIDAHGLSRCFGVVHALLTRGVKSRPNTDGIEPLGCTDVFISGCYVHNGDDCLTVKGGHSPGRHCQSTLFSTILDCHPLGSCAVFLLSLLSLSAKMTVPPRTKGGCEDVLITDSYFASGHGASIGSVTDIGVRNVTFRSAATHLCCRYFKVR